MHKGTDYKLALGDGIVDDQISKIMKLTMLVGMLERLQFHQKLSDFYRRIFSPMPGGALTANTL